MYSAYSLDFPFADQWDMVPLIEKALNGHFVLRDYWAQHNEHRLLFPRLLMLAMALLSDWNVYWELAANFILALLAWGLTCGMAWNSGREIHKGSDEPVYLLFTLIFFSLTQWGNWFLGWQLQEFMNVLAVIAAFAFLSRRRHYEVALILAIASGVVATFSFASGILVWPIGAVLLVLQRRDRKKKFRQHLSVWGVASAVVIVAYLAGYRTPPHHAPLLSAIQQPGQCVLYVLAYLGQPVGRLEDLFAIAGELIGRPPEGSDQVFSVLMGGLVLILWVTSFAQLQLSGVKLRVLLPWLGMAMYAAGAAALTALGRVDEGLEQAMSSRYATMANLIWLPVVAQFYWVAHVSHGDLSRRMLPYKVAILGAALVGASLAGAYRWTERYHAYQALRPELLSGSDVELLRPLYPPAPETILERRLVLERFGLGVFHENAGSDGYTVPPAEEIPPL